MDAQQRFLTKIQILGDCWIWQAARDADGYGMFWFNGRTQGAHKFSAEHLAGLDIPKGHCVCHRCDNPSCVNPSHLFTASSADNTRDRHSKGRSARGSGVGTSKLTEQQVNEIRQRYKDANGRRGILTELAKEYGTTVTPIWAICHGLGWRHLL